MLHFEQRVLLHEQPRFICRQRWQLVVFGLKFFDFAAHARHELVVAPFRVCANDQQRVAQVALHGELPDGRREVRAHLLLLCIVSNAFADVIVAAQAPAVVRHLETDDEDAFADFGCTLAQRAMTVVEFIETSLLWRPFGRIVKVVGPCRRQSRHVRLFQGIFW